MPTAHPILVGAVQCAVTAVTTALILNHLNDGSKSATKSESREVADKLGPWASEKRGSKTDSLLGPQITARLADKFCGINDVLLSRVPQGDHGSASWSVLLALIHRTQNPTTIKETNNEWTHLPLAPLMKHEGELCIRISRATLMTLMALTNARPIFSYASAAGYRSAHPAYSGQWTIAWPLGKPCIVRLAPHDSHSAATDVYPPMFAVRVDKCVNMLAGIVTDGEWKVGFSGRAKTDGDYVVRFQEKGFGNSHGSRHLYNMEGGKVFEVDMLALVAVQIPGANKGQTKMQIPALNGGLANLYLPPQEARLLARALDCLPWSSLSWSLHRGMKDVLLAYGKTTMNRHRKALASLLKDSMEGNFSELVSRGWAPEFVKGPMAQMAESAILAGVGNSGDVVRIVVAIVEAILDRMPQKGAGLDKDRTEFWQKQFEADEGRFDGTPDAVVALTKFFVLEWSQELDYQLYHNLPVDVLLA